MRAMLQRYGASAADARARERPTGVSRRLIGCETATVHPVSATRPVR
jgi:hypothetical protein